MNLMRRNRTGVSRASKQDGFTMIEVLIAILVLAFGLLGFALLQTMNVRFTKSAQQRTVATNLAYELVDVMRSQRSLASYYNAIDSASFDAVAPATEGCERVANATPSANIARWKCEVRTALPDGRADVNLVADGSLTVDVSWGEVPVEGETEAASRSNVTVESRL